MCGRYSVIDLANYVDRFKTINKSDFRPNYNAAPTQQLPIIIPTDGGNIIENVHWGIPRVLGKDFVKEIINTRADKAFSGFWRKTVVNNRCLVPANSFFEWQKQDDGKHPFLIRPKDESLFAFAGIWSDWTNKEGITYRTYSIMTTEPNHEMKSIHDRMPVILQKEDEQTWLNHNLEQETIERLLFPSQDGRLEMYEVSKDVNNVRNNNADILNPVS